MDSYFSIFQVLHAISPDSNYFVTGSLDKTSKVYDLREKRIAQITYRYHQGDVNSVRFVLLSTFSLL